MTDKPRNFCEQIGSVLKIYSPTARALEAGLVEGLAQTVDHLAVDKLLARGTNAPKFRVVVVGAVELVIVDKEAQLVQLPFAGCECFKRMIYRERDSFLKFVFHNHLDTWNIRRGRIYCWPSGHRQRIFSGMLHIWLFLKIAVYTLQWNIIT